ARPSARDQVRNDRHQPRRGHGDRVRARARGRAREPREGRRAAARADRARRMTNVYEEIVRLQRLGEPCAVATIITTGGSTRGKTTVKMLVRRDGSFVRTVGGGCLEAEVLEAALQSMRDEKSRTLEFALNERDYPDSGLLCGGQLQIFVEPIVVPR